MRIIMKSLIKIVLRYVVTAQLITIFIIAANLGLFMYWGFRSFEGDKDVVYTKQAVEDISREFNYSSGSWDLSKKGYEKLKESAFAWAMYINGKGEVSWSCRLPREIPRSYTLADISVLSKWYLKDYPVKTWTYGDGILVYGCRKETVVRFNVQYSYKFIKNIPNLVRLFFITNITWILILAFWAGWRFYRSLRPVVKGIGYLCQNIPVCLPEKGITGELSQKINQASLIIEEQREKLSKRDKARTTWISGVSHDIRTPLSIIIGYGDSLLKEDGIKEDSRAQLLAMQRQSQVIKQLIADLNLTSRLEYDQSPLRLEEYGPAPLLREITAGYYNDGLEDGYGINLEIEEIEGICLTGDTALLGRAFKNIIGNSIRHNKAGCEITISAVRKTGTIHILFEDTGKGIPPVIINALYQEDIIGENPPHVMGLRVVNQIILAHGGRLDFVDNKRNGFSVIVILPGQEKI